MLFALCLLATPALAQSREYDRALTNPVIGTRFPDPTVIRAEDGTYYAYATLGAMARSRDLQHWESLGAFTAQQPDGWHWGAEGTALWAPSVRRFGAQYVMHYAIARLRDPNPAIGVATAPHPQGPWQDHGKLFDSQGIGVNNSIDPCAFTAEDGKAYLVWGSFRGIYIAGLRTDGLALLHADGHDRQLLAGLDTTLPFNVHTYEGAEIRFHNGYYYLFLSTGTTLRGMASTYRVVVGRARTPTGPYLDEQGRDLRAPDRGRAVISGTAGFAGPGHNGIAVDDEGNWWLLYHAWNRADVKAGRTLMIDRLVWTIDGWPEVPGGHPHLTPFATAAPPPEP